MPKVLLKLAEGNPINELSKLTSSEEMKSILCAAILLVLAVNLIECHPVKKQSSCDVTTTEGSRLYNCTYGFAESSESACSCKDLLQSYADDCSQTEDNAVNKRQVVININVRNFLNNLQVRCSGQSSASILVSTLLFAVLAGLTSVLN